MHQGGLQREAAICRNGAVAVLARDAGTTMLQVSRVNLTLLLAAGDVIALYGFQATGSPLNARAGGETFLTLRRVAVV
jgi:hypothetical protein